MTGPNNVSVDLTRFRQASVPPAHGAAQPLDPRADHERRGIPRLAILQPPDEGLPVASLERYDRGVELGIGAFEARHRLGEYRARFLQAHGSLSRPSIPQRAV